jgi:hypothetical protein
MWKWLTRSLMVAFVATLGLSSGQAEAKAPNTPTAKTQVKKDTSSVVTTDTLLPSEQDAFRGLVPPVIAILINLVVPGIGLGSFIQGDWNGGWTIIGTGLLGWVLLITGGVYGAFASPLGGVMILAGIASLTFSAVWSIVAPLQFGYSRRRRWRRRRRRYYRRRRYRRPYYKDYKLGKADKATPQSTKAAPVGTPAFAVQF